MRFNPLTDGYDDGIRLQTDRLHTRGIRPGTVGPVMLTDDLRLCPQGGHMMKRILFDPQRRMEGKISAPSAMAPSTSSAWAVISSCRLR